MADLNTKTFTQLVEGQAAAVQARSTALIDYTIGSLMRAFAEAIAGVVLWLQSIILGVLMLSRAATSNGADLDSWIADFGGPFIENGATVFGRLPAVSATGAVTFSRFSSVGIGAVPAGATIETADGTQRYVVVADPENVAWSEADQAYLLSDGQATISVPAMALVGGLAGNANAGQIDTITSAIPGIDQVTNPLAFENGLDAETDAALRVRFRGYIQALADGTPPAIMYWLRAMGVTVTAQIVEYQLVDGTPKPAYFYVIVDDGSGAPDADFIAAATAQVDLHRAAGVEFDVYGSSVLAVAVAMDILTSNPLDHDDAAALVVLAVEAYLDSLALGEKMVFNKLYQVIYGASPLIIDVDNLVANAGVVDIVPAVGQTIKAGAVTVG